VLVIGAIERAPKGKRGFGRARLAVVANAKSETQREFITANNAPGSVLIRDASRPITCSLIWTSSPSGSNGVPPGNAACCSSGYWSERSRPTRPGTSTSWPIPNRQIVPTGLLNGAAGPACWRSKHSTGLGAPQNESLEPLH